MGQSKLYLVVMRVGMYRRLLVASLGDDGTQEEQPLRRLLARLFVSAFSACKGKLRPILLREVFSIGANRLVLFHR